MSERNNFFPHFQIKLEYIIDSEIKCISILKNLVESKSKTYT